MRKTLIAGLVAACLSLPLAGAAQDALFGNPKLFKTNGGLKPAAERTVYLPVTQVKWMVHGAGSARGFSTTMYQEVNSPIDAARIGKIAQALHDDLVSQLETAGWNVQTRQELGADVPRYKPASADGELGVPTIKERGGTEYVLIAPADMPAVANEGMALAGINMATNGFIRGKPGVNLFVTYSFATAAIQETKSRMLGMETKPVLSLSGAIMAQTANSSYFTYNDAVPVASDIGTLEQTHATSTATKILRFAAGMRQIDKKVYTLQPDWDKLEAEAIRGGKAFNAEIVARLK